MINCAVKIITFCLNYKYIFIIINETRSYLKSFLSKRNRLFKVYYILDLINKIDYLARYFKKHTFYFIIS